MQKGNLLDLLDKMIKTGTNQEQADTVIINVSAVVSLRRLTRVDIFRSSLKVPFRVMGHKYARNYGGRGPPNKHSHVFFLPVANYPHFILNQYQEVGQKPAHTPTPKKNE